jgi:serine/threonine protein kinase
MYKLSRVPLGRGAFSLVYRAQHRVTGEWVALKRTNERPLAHDRIRREIEVQHQLAPHPHIMPILDYDPGFQWYTMPVACGTLMSLREDLGQDELASIMADLAGALEAAHHKDLVHRDISPLNILALDGEHGLRWVVADWGMVQRPYGSTSPRLTRTGMGAGTPGFDAPELVTDARNATPAADVYALGRIAAWFLTGRMPVSGHQLLPDGQALHWRMFVKACTEHDPADRLPNMAALREELTRVFVVYDEPPQVRTGRLLEEVIADRGAIGGLMEFAAAYASDPVIYLDHIARVPTGQIRRWASQSPDLAAAIAGHMARHLRMSPWEDRDPEYAGTPLLFIFTILQLLTDAGHFASALDAADGFFAAEAAWRHDRQRQRTVRWLSDLQAPADGWIARALAKRADLLDYYRPGLTPRSSTLKAIFHV